ncbi:acetylglutamate kinase [Candidatus Kaiserbacteria bacterium RIFCSPHIGHO2_02_FULL_59_21]|uniref:Acetylglutamate kinase n=1 Tax=Candidatus Kaiserbacteria bacterium RIFCSPHIGHO2_02_FULL_59_21 TaxID=1798500 RepID=A0A1F6DZP2_9BACT|nr:MAG: acetylglutamate kinase [Candidatus Kaiserbacteria bacterium RIFCSPHIGHO2_01_FULL_58_22]OGG66770.1 MAG: acetylglutamate kinase [Candidatus Kaiserbacteria bacterium RIFCSPHIGHO2_02_FULL_59_21]OGG87091.1 MAG: acetylglutamate kinase [Candidatus Kaiserbacteria bacterium RIFCSPLOWO2_02_FULL_59_19]
MQNIIKKADVLLEALPYIRNFYDKAVVIKYGGAAMTDTQIRKDVLEDVVFMSYVGMRPILVHGGGPAVSNRMKAIGKESKFVKGFRVTDEETMQIAEEEFLKINREIVNELKALGGSAITLSGKDDRVIEVKKHPPIDGEDIGFVGEITKVNSDVIQKMLVGDIIPVIPPVGVGAKDGHAYNINADQVAAEVAGAIGAIKLVLLTNVGGIMKDVNDKHSRIAHVTLDEIDTLVQSGIVSGGMIPKLNACTRALKKGVKKTHIIDAGIPHGILLEIFTDKGIGTEIVKNGNKKSV